jgi:Tfp pilus assembly protein PilP
MQVRCQSNEINWLAGAARHGSPELSKIPTPQMEFVAAIQYGAAALTDPAEDPPR